MSKILFQRNYPKLQICLRLLGDFFYKHLGTLGAYFSSLYQEEYIR